MRSSRAGRSVFRGCFVVFVIVAVGCGSPPPPPRPVGQAEATPAVVISDDVRKQLLDGAIAVLGRLEDYEEESAFAQVFDRLSQWSHAVTMARGKAAGDWLADPLFAALPDRLRAGTTPESLASPAFDASVDPKSLRDQRWLADIAAAARGDAIEDLEIAGNLFRWTVRSLAPVGDPPMVPTEANPGSRWFLPGEILLSGRASPAQRAWIFLELLRHAGIDGVMLATGSADGGSLRAWVPAVIAGGEAWLFEPTFGMPIPGPDGTGVASARQAAEDPAILERLSFPDRAYPVKAADVGGLSVLVAGDPWNLSRRMRAIDAELAGTQRMELALDASALGERALRALPAGDGKSGRVGLWEFPWETLVRRRDDKPRVQAAVARELAVMSVALAKPVGEGREGRRSSRIVRPLYAARLRDFRGELDGPEGAKADYLAARPGKQAVADLLQGAAPEQAEAMKRLFEQMKEDATYWLGILTLAEGDDQTAADYLGRMMLEAAPDSRWTDAARVNLARALTNLGRTAEAVKVLRADASPQRFGSRFLAEALEKREKP
jgi:hypothetical protein